MSSWKKVLLGGAAIAALSGTSALADFTATFEPNTRLANTTGNLNFDNDSVAPAEADGTLVISNFTAVPDELTQGNQITFTLSNGVFHVLPTNTINAGAGGCPVAGAGPGQTGTLNFQSGGAGSNSVTYEIDQNDVDLGAGCTITLSNIVIRSGYTSTTGSRIDITLSDLAGELVPAIAAGSGSNTVPGPNTTPNDDRTETLFVFTPGTSSTVVPDGDDNVNAGLAEDGIEYIELDPPSLGELFDDDFGAAGPDSFADLGDITITELNAISGAGATVNASSVDFEISGPFSSGIASIYLDDDACAATVPGAGSGRILGTISGDTASFPDTAATAAPLTEGGNDLGTNDGLGTADLNVCVITDSTVQNGTLLLAGQYSGEVTVTTSASTTETGSGNLDETQYQNGKVTRIAYAFGGGSGYGWYMPVTTMTASPVIVLVKDDDGNEWTGVLEDPLLYPASNAGGVQDENTHVLYTAGDINDAVAGTPLDDETTRAGIWVFTADDATVGSVILNPTSDLGAVNVFED